jgi:protein TonB
MVEHVNLEESELYALGVLDGDARHAVEEHLRACEPCAHHIALAHQMVSLVGLTSAPARPSPSVRDKVMRRVRAAHAEHWVETKPVQIAELRVQPEPEKEPEPEPVVQPVQQAPERRVLWLAVTLTVLLAAGASAGFWVTHRAHQKQAAAVEQQTQPGAAAPATAVPNAAAVSGQTNAGQTNAGQANKETTGPNRATATAPAREQAATAAASEPETLTSALDTPQRIVTSAAPRSDAPPPPSLAMGADLGAGGAALPALPGSSAEPRVQEAAPSGPIRVAGGVAAARLLAPIQASYPDIARQSHIQGTVVVDAIISTTGRVRYSHVVSGPALLTGAALSAVQRARYRPFVVNGAAVEAETAITLNFTLN